MIKVITYGTFDLLHNGHVRLLERAKALGDYLIVGITSEDFDKARGKINVQQSLMERVAAVRALDIADDIIVEEYVGQKIDDIKRYDIDIFTLGSDWEGKFDYLKEYCDVIYLPRTEGISSTHLRERDNCIKLSLMGHHIGASKIAKECTYVNGVKTVDDISVADAIYVDTLPEYHYRDVKNMLLAGKHVICESPLATRELEARELIELARQKGLVLMDGIKSAYATAYSRLLLLVKSGAIGEVISIDSTCTSISDELLQIGETEGRWNSICAWGTIALLPIFQILGTEYNNKHIVSRYVDKEKKFDGFTKIDFEYSNAVASIKVAKTAKSEGSLVITGTKGYIYVPAPWWKTEYFEIRFEDPVQNKRFFYQLEGEGIRYELVAFNKAISTGKDYSYISSEVSIAISKIVEEIMH